MAGHSLPVPWTVAAAFSAREGTEASYLRFALTGIKNDHESKVEGKSEVSTQCSKEKKEKRAQEAGGSNSAICSTS